MVLRQPTPKSSATSKQNHAEVNDGKTKTGTKKPKTTADQPPLVCRVQWEGGGFDVYASKDENDNITFVGKGTSWGFDENEDEVVKGFTTPTFRSLVALLDSFCDPGDWPHFVVDSLNADFALDLREVSALAQSRLTAGRIGRNFGQSHDADRQRFELDRWQELAKIGTADFDNNSYGNRHDV